MQTAKALAIRAALCAALAGQIASASAAEMSIVETFGTWQVVTDNLDPHQFCFVTSEPASTKPENATRDAPRAYISAWPKDGIKEEVSFRMGFPVKKDAEALARIDPSGFRLFASSDRVFVRDSTQELKLVEAMKKGSKLIVSVTSERGTEITDTYTLQGIGSALQKLQENCF